MGFVGGYILGLVSAIIPQVLLFFLLPALEEPRRRFLAWIQRRPHIAAKLMAEIRILEQVVPKLSKINAIPSDPDRLKPMDIRDILQEVGTEAQKLNDKHFSELRRQLIELSDQAKSISVNTSSLTILNMLGREKAINLANDIRQMISETINEKAKKKKAD